MNTPAKTRAWHALAIEQAIEASGVDPIQGLSSTDVAQRLAAHGPNRLAEPPPRSPWVLLLEQFKSVLILILIGAALLAGAIGDIKDAVVILMVVLFNSALGFYQEYRAERSLAALKKMLALTARVRRDGQIIEIPADALVPGEQFGVAGATVVRGYREREVVGDSAVVASAELLGAERTWFGLAWRPVLFVDAARAWNQLDTPCLGNQSRCTLASAGVGLRSAPGGPWQLRADVAVALKEGTRTERNHARLHLAASYTFE